MDGEALIYFNATLNKEYSLLSIKQHVPLSLLKPIDINSASAILSTDPFD